MIRLGIKVPTYRCMQCFYIIIVLIRIESFIVKSLIYLVRVSRINHIAYCRNCRYYQQDARLSSKMFCEKKTANNTIISERDMSKLRHELRAIAKYKLAIVTEISNFIYWHFLDRLRIFTYFCEYIAYNTYVVDYRHATMHCIFSGCQLWINRGTFANFSECW